jgi:hypothetical protein
MFARKGVPGDWPNHLTQEALDILLDECGAAMRLAGYPTSLLDEISM